MHAEVQEQQSYLWKHMRAEVQVEKLGNPRFITSPPPTEERVSGRFTKEDQINTKARRGPQNREKQWN